MTTKHTELPWKYAPTLQNGDGYPEWIKGSIKSETGWYICAVENTENPVADAAFIVRAVNNHYQLLEALKAVVEDDGFGMSMAIAAIKQAEEDDHE